MLTLNGSAFQVIGVMPADFVFPYPGMLGPSGFTRVTSVDGWLPIAFSGPMAATNRMLTAQGQIVRNVHWFGAIGRPKSGVAPEQVEADMKTIASQLEQAYPNTNKGWSATVVRSIDQSVGTIRPALMILLAGIGFVLVMASVNVANLLLARSIAREKELATRAALGAGRTRIARQLLTESVLFAIAGGLVGMLVMWWTIRGLVALAPAGLPRMNEVSVDWRVLLTAGVMTMVTGILVGLLPALSSASVNPNASLQDASRGAVGGALRRRARSGLVIAEVALAVAITTGAVLLLRSFVSVTNVNPGFETTQLLTWQMNLPQRLTNNTDRLAFYRNFFERMEALPGVVSVGGTTRVPLGSTSVTTTVQIEGRPVPAAELPEVQFRRAMHNYFAAMGIPIRRGRGFDPNDGPTAPPVAVINETMAQKLFPNQDPLGQHIRTGPNANGSVDDDRRCDRRHPPRRARGSAAAGDVHQLSAGTAGVAVHRAANHQRSGAARRDRAGRSAPHRQEPADLRDAHHVDAALGCGVDTSLHPVDRRRFRIARARPGGDWRLRRDVVDRQRADA